MKDRRFPPHELDLSETAKFTLLWATKDPAWVIEAKICWVLFEMALHMVISQRLRLSSTLYAQYESIADFKEDFHNLHVHARRDP